MNFLNWLKNLLEEMFKTAEAEPTPKIDGHLVVIIGHGMNSDKGAYGIAPLSMFETDYNKLVASDMASYAKKLGLPCTVLSKTGKTTYGVGAEATRTVKEAKKGCVIELHFNSYNGAASGTETLYDRDEKDNKLFAEICQKKMVALFGRPNRGVKDRTVGRGGSNLDSVKVTSCLVEPLFGDNKIDAGLLKTRRKEYAACLVDAAAEYIGGL